MSFVVHRTLAVAGVVLTLLFLWKVRQALLIGFAGVLVAVFIRGLARQVERRTPLGIKPAIATVAVLLLAATVAFWTLLGPSVATQFNELSRSIPQSIEQLRTSLAGSAWGSALLEQMSGSPASFLSQESLSRVQGIAQSVLSALAGAVVVLFIGIFLVVDPHLYRRGVVHLVPKRYHDLTWETLNALGQALWHWLLGQFASMLFVFVATTAALWFLGVPLALVLGFIAGLLDFVPWVGPIAASIPAVLLAFTLGPTKALYVALAYLVIQQLEGNLVMPIVQHHAVSLPPVLVLLALTGFGLLFGILGILLATPLLVVAMVLVNKLYVEHGLGEEVHVPGEDD